VFALLPSLDPMGGFASSPVDVQLYQTRKLDVDVHSFYNESTLKQRIPHRFLARGRFWLISQVLFFLTSPNAALKAKTEAARQQLAMTSPVLSVHVRKGDACGDRGECRGLGEYMPSIRKMISSYGFKTVFLASPDATVLSEVSQYPDVSFKYETRGANTTALMKAKGIRKIDDAIAQGVLDAGDEFADAMISTYLLSQGDAFLGGFSSNAARLAYSIMSAGPQGCLKPFESSDINWCAAFAKGGEAVLRRDGQSCMAAKKQMETLPCNIQC